MYEIHTNKKFRTAYKRLAKSGNFKDKEFNEIIKSLENGEELPERYHDHILKGNLLGQRECHITGDILLIYETDNADKIVRLLNIGNHAQLFES